MRHFTELNMQKILKIRRQVSGQMEKLRLSSSGESSKLRQLFLHRASQ